MPTDPTKRAALVGRLLAWLGRVTDGQLGLARLILYRDEEWLLDAHDGFPGTLLLRPTEFAELQACWERRGLPRDLYYPAREERFVMEPVEKYGGVVRVNQRYSPLQWARRDRVAIESLIVPSEEERRVKFVEECDRFSQYLTLRAHELLEPGTERNLKEVNRIFALAREVADLAQQARHRDAQQEPDPAP